MLMDVKSLENIEKERIISLFENKMLKIKKAEALQAFCLQSNIKLHIMQQIETDNMNRLIRIYDSQENEYTIRLYTIFQILKAIKHLRNMKRDLLYEFRYSSVDTKEIREQIKEFFDRLFNIIKELRAPYLKRHLKAKILSIKT